MPTPTTWLSNFQVTTTGNPAAGTSRITGLASGNFLVSWVEAGTTGVGTEAGDDIIGAIYDAQGDLV